MTEKLLEGRHALVTGASGAIGRATAIRLAKMGANVVVHGRDLDRTEEAADAVRALGLKAFVVTGELSGANEVDAVIEAVREYGATIDVLVCNAGGKSSKGMDAWFDVPPEEWLETYEINVMSTFRLCRAFVPGMVERGWGRVILVSSRVADMPLKTIPDYQASKAGVSSMARSLSKALGGTGVTANSVSPGFILTDTSTPMVIELAVKAGVDGNDWSAVNKWGAKRFAPNGSGRLGIGDDVAHAIAFLASSEAGYVNGADIHVDGG